MREIATQLDVAMPAKTGPRRAHRYRDFRPGSLRLVGVIAPRSSTVALTEPDFPEVGMPGVSPWLGGLDIDDVAGDAAPAATQGSTAISMVHGDPEDGSVSDPGHRPFVPPRWLRTPVPGDER